MSRPRASVSLTLDAVKVTRQAIESLNVRVYEGQPTPDHPNLRTYVLEANFDDEPVAAKIQWEHTAEEPYGRLHDGVERWLPETMQRELASRLADVADYRACLESIRAALTIVVGSPS